MRISDWSSDVCSSDLGQAGTLEITVWGPRQTTAGDPFNVQQGGQAAIWIRVDQPLDGWIAQIEFDDAVLEGHGSCHLVTAVVPEAFYANRGTYEVRVAARKANALRLRNTVLFHVWTGSPALATTLAQHAAAHLPGTLTYR